MTRFFASRVNLLPSAIVLVLAFAIPASAQVQLRYVTGSVVERWGVFSPPGQTATITTQLGAPPNGKICVPPASRTAFDPCNGNVYPFIGGNNVEPVRPTGAIHNAGLAVGDPVDLPYASEWTQDVTGMIGNTQTNTSPLGTPVVQTIWTLFDGRNAVAVPATGNGFAAGGGPGSTVWRPLGAGVAADPGHMTLSFPNPQNPGATTTPGVSIASPMPPYPVVPNTSTQPGRTIRATYTAGPRQFGGTAAILTDTPNRLTLALGPTNYIRTNGKCRSGEPFGDCQVGFAIGSSRVFTSIRRHVNANASSIVLAQPGRWQGHPWTTGTVSVKQDLAGNGETSLAWSGTDVVTSMGARNLVLVSPILNYDYGISGDLGGGAHIVQWDMLIQTPEPAAALALASGLGLLGLFHMRARRKS